MDHSLALHMASTSSLASSEFSAISGATNDSNGHENGPPNGPQVPSVETLGKLVVDMKAVIQEERWKRSEIEKRNHALLQELEHLQREVIDLKTNNVQLHHEMSLSQARHSAPTNNSTNAPPPLQSCPSSCSSTSSLLMPMPQDEPPHSQSDFQSHDTEFWIQELQQARKDKQKAIVEAHQKAMQVMELNACVSMQHDEIKALRTHENETRFALINAEDRVKELVHQNTLCQQENNLLKDDVSHLTTEINKRSAQVNNLLEKYTTCQTLYDQSVKEAQSLGDKLKNAQFESDRIAIELGKTEQERDELQHQVNQLKGAVAAKCAESRAFQTYGNNAREYLQNQNTIIQRNVIHRRKIQKVTRDGILTLRAMKSSLVIIREPIVAMQKDFVAFCRQLQGPVLTLVRKSQRFVALAHDEVQPLRQSLLQTEEARKHLHEQVWRARNNSLMVCQIRHSSPIPSGARGIPTTTTVGSSPKQLSMVYPLDATGNTSSSPSKTRQMFTLNANYALKQVVYKQKDSENVIAIPFDAIYSDKSHEWNANDCLRPLVQSVIDGKNACVATFDGFTSVQIVNATCSSVGSSTSETRNNCINVPDLVIRELFEAIGPAQSPFNHFKVTLSYLAVFDETVFDLLAITDPVLTKPGGQDNKQMVVLQVQNSQDMDIALREARDNLTKNHQAYGLTLPRYAHQVLTFGIQNESVLTNQTSKSKLQIVVLAQPELCEVATTQDSATSEETPVVKATVTMENGINALINALAETRYKDPAFVRYHSSKITILLQETIHFSSKFMLLVSLCTNFPRDVQQQQPQQDTASAAKRLRQVIDKLQHFRNALYGSSTNGGIGGGTSSLGNAPSYSTGTTAGGASDPTGTPKLFANVDRSFQGFMSRFYQCQHDAFPEQVQLSNLRCFPLTFPNGSSSSSPLLTSRSHQFDNGTWEKELDRMTKRTLDIQNRPQALNRSLSASAANAGPMGSSSSPQMASIHGPVSTSSGIATTHEPTLYETDSFNVLSQTSTRPSVVMSSRRSAKKLGPRQPQQQQQQPQQPQQRASKGSGNRRSLSISSTPSRLRPRSSSLLRHTAASYNKVTSKQQQQQPLARRRTSSYYELSQPVPRTRSFKNSRRPRAKTLATSSFQLAAGITSSLVAPGSSSSSFLVHARRETASSAQKRVLLNRSVRSRRTIPFR